MLSARAGARAAQTPAAPMAAVPTPRARGDRGSSLLLMPAAVLIVLVLGAIAVDLTVVRLAHRDLLDVAASAANDAAGAGLDPATFRRSGAYRIDRRRAEDAVARSLAAHHLDDRVQATVILGPGPDEVTVELTTDVGYVFARSLPGAAHSTTVHARASAAAARR